MKRKNLIIMGAAGRDFHNFNTMYRDNEEFQVVAFTATQIPNIDGRAYPPELAGRLYPKGIPIVPEHQLVDLILQYNVDEVIFSYSDVSYQHVMTLASKVTAVGAKFSLLGAQETMLPSRKPVVAVVAVRTGAGKSQTSRKICEILRSMDLRVVSVRHPMPYGDLVKQKVQCYTSLEDLKRYQCTVEEMEEYEPHIAAGTIVYAGVDYAAILEEAERKADVIVWDGGNNDMSFFRPDLTITLVDPLRPGHELAFYPGSTNLLLADVVIINKVDSASREDVECVRGNIAKVNPGALIIEAASPIHVDRPDLISGRRVLVVEDGPTLTHGDMGYGAGVIAARKYGAREIVDPRPWAVGSIADTYRKYPRVGTLLPAMGYGPRQIRELETTINDAQCDTVVIGTPVDLTRIIRINKPSVRVRYDLSEISRPDISEVLNEFVERHSIAPHAAIIPTT
jgi:predicted GTPase